MNSRQIITALSALSLMFCSSALFAATRTVGVGKDYADIQSAYNAASSGDEIVIDAGTYTLSEALYFNSDNKNVTVRGATGDAADVVISGGGTVPCLTMIGTMAGSSVTLAGLTFANGQGIASRSGGVEINQYGHNFHLTVTNCVIRDCANTVSVNGGAGCIYVAYNDSGVDFIDCEICDNTSNQANGNQGAAGISVCQNSYNVNFRDCRFHHNVFTGTAYGAALRYRIGNNCEVRDCWFYDNNGDQGYGGAIYPGSSAVGQVVVADCVISNNTAAIGGGAFVSKGYFTNTLFVANSSTTWGGGSGGGAAYLQSDCGEFYNCHFTDNTANMNGGALLPKWVAGGNFVIDGCVFKGNSAGNDGGAICRYAQNSSTDTIIRNCLFDGNSAKLGGGASIQLGWATDGKFAVESCTFVNNRATNGSAGMSVTDPAGDLGDRFHCTDCVFFMNTWGNDFNHSCNVGNNAGALGETIATTFSYCASDNTAFGGFQVVPAGTGNVTTLTTAAFMDYANCDYAPAFGGAIQDAGVTLGWMTNAKDIAGNRRVSSKGSPKNADIGAYEWQASWTSGSCGHPNADVEPGVPATCTESGYADSIYCDDCETQLSNREVIPALGHHPGDTIRILTPVSAVSAGYSIATCSRCGVEIEVNKDSFGIGYASNPSAATLSAEAALTDAAGVVYVATTGDDESGTGAIANPFATIAGALAKTSGAVEIRVLHGRYQITEPIDLSNRSVTLKGAAGDRDAVIIDAQGLCRGIVGRYGTKDISSITVINGKSNVYSGLGNIYSGAFNFCNGSVVISNCTAASSVSDCGAGGIGIEAADNAVVVDTFVFACTNTSYGNNCTGGGMSLRANVEERTDNCQFVACHANYYGGGAVSQSGSIDSCMFYGNTAGYGGAGAALRGTGIRDCWFENNSAPQNGCTGGGLYVWADGGNKTDASAAAVVSGCTFKDNTACNGGAIAFAQNANAYWGGSIVDCVIEGNTASQGGGGIWMDRPQSSLCERLVIRNNTAVYGGGILVYGTSTQDDNRSITFRNCLLTGNSTTADGGAGIYLNAVTDNLKIENCTIVGNTSKNNLGAGIYLRRVYNGGAFGTFEMINTVIGENNGTGGNKELFVHDQVGYANWGENISYSATGATAYPFPGDSNLNNLADLGFTDAENGDYSLVKGSPLVDNGITMDWARPQSVKDIAGLRRFRGDAVDIGAYEYPDVAKRFFLMLR